MLKFISNHGVGTTGNDAEKMTGCSKGLNGLTIGVGDDCVLSEGAIEIRGK